jgi:hypothetical protein
MKNEVITLEMIQQMRREKLKEIRAAGKTIKNTTSGIFSPQERQTGVNGLMQQVGTGIAIYDGVMTGIKIIRQIRKMFKRRRY